MDSVLFATGTFAFILLLLVLLAGLFLRAGLRAAFRGFACFTGLLLFLFSFSLTFAVSIAFGFRDYG
jgi:hypothetical protein